ncbi:hypothetical protein ACFYOT_40005 [Saccharothrix saharensis]|uniref:hypothetical protein n=1 Tax=Saccharothrix saharensis TaxID=571190 RepID=UPI0036B924CF
MHRSNLCIALRIRFEHAGDAEDLREAIAAGRAAARETAVDATPDTRAARLWALGVALSVGYEHFGDEDDLHEATALAEEVVAVTPAGHAEEVRGLNLLAHQLVMRFERSGEVGLIDRAVECHRRASRIMPDGYAGRDTVLTGLTSALVRRYMRVGRVADLDEAVRVGRSAVAASRPGSSNHAACADAFCRALTSRYRHTGEPADLDEAIEVGRHAVRMIAPSHLDRAVPLTTLSRALVHRHGMRNDPADRREAISLAREAFARIGATHVLWPKVARHLADVLASGSEGSAGDRDDLAEAERLCHTALARASTVDERVDLLGLLGNIAFATADGRPEGFDRAVDFHRQVLGLLPPDIPGRAAHHMVIGAALHRRFAASGDPADAEAAIAAYREAGSDPRDLPAVRARAARHWAVSAMTRGDHRSALDGFTAAIALLPALTGRRLDRVTRQSLIAEWSGAAADAAACALVEGQPKRAVELLDHGRSVLWSDALRSRQGPLDPRRTPPRGGTTTHRVAHRARRGRDRGSRTGRPRRRLGGAAARRADAVGGRVGGATRSGAAITRFRALPPAHAVRRVGPCCRRWPGCRGQHQ